MSHGKLVVTEQSFFYPFMMSKRGNTSMGMERSALEIRSNNALSDSHMLLFYTKAQWEHSSGANGCSALVRASFVLTDETIGVKRS